MEQQLYDLTALEEVAGGDKEFMDSMIQLFSSNTPEDMRTMELALEQKDYNTVTSTAHKMKPSVNYICISELIDDLNHLLKWEDEIEVMIEQTISFIANIKVLLVQINNRG